MFLWQSSLMSWCAKMTALKSRMRSYWDSCASESRFVCVCCVSLLHLSYVSDFIRFLLGQYLVLYSALLSCLDYCIYSLVFFLVLLSVANKDSFIHSLAVLCCTVTLCEARWFISASVCFEKNSYNNNVSALSILKIIATKTKIIKGQ